MSDVEDFSLLSDDERADLERARGLAATFDAMNAELRPVSRAEAVRADLCKRFPAEFEHGYRTGYLGENQPPCDASGYMIGHHTWPLVRKNAWFAGFNLGHFERGEGDG
jgi:hypothetical protein